MTNKIDKMIDKMRIKDEACTICNGINSNGRAISEKRCDECVKNNKKLFIGKSNGIKKN